MLRRRTVLLLLAAPLAVYGLLFAGSIAEQIHASLTGTVTLADPDPGWTTGQYQLALTDGGFTGIWATTLWLSLVAAVLATALGAAVSLTLWRAGGRIRTVMTLIIIAPMLVSSVVRAYGWLTTIGRGGLLSQTATLLGLDAAEIGFGRTAVIIGLVHVLLPYSVLLILGSLDAINPSTTRAAASLGAGPVRTTLRVVVPLSAPGLASSLLVTFSLAAASYSIPTILGGGRVYTIARAIFQESTASFNLPLAAALSVLLIAGCLTTALAAQRISRRSRDRVERIGLGAV
ncbi:hypothetical protein Acsp03_49810 [Actinomadura sp. NBRC 104412]|nr:hypothetical protein Acsp03_49810 [Actinomadura sp. NBRC 104412]